jgi:NAD(P)-dependent dehydrogenase (short-subunit alcohol dehydrogenase family)
MAREEPDITATLADVAQVGDVSRVFEDLNDRYGELDVLINNVGISGPTAAMEDIDIEAWHETINVNLNSLFYVSRLAIPLLKRSSGQIVNMASNAGLYGCPLRSPYVAAKWAMIGLTKTLAMELGAHGVRVNAICPGSVDGPRIDKVIENDAISRGVSEAEIRSAYLTQSSLGKFIEAEDIAQTILFLCSDGAKTISGQAIPIDGHTESLSTRP